MLQLRALWLLLLLLTAHTVCTAAAVSVPIASVAIPGPEPAPEVLAASINSINSNSSSNSSAPLSVSVVTWNFAEKCPSEHDALFLKGMRGRDLIVLGVQECEDIKPRRHEGHRSRAWRALQKKVFGKQYKCIAQHKMGGLQMAVYGSKRAAKQVQGLQILDVACGVGNVLTNKGGICVLLRIKGKTLALINGHFAAHQTKVAERNADFHRILRSVTTRAQQRWLVRDLAAKRKRASKAAKAAGGEPWLEQVFQFAGMPEDRGFQRRGAVQAASNDNDDGDGSAKGGKKSKRGGRSKKSEGKFSSKSAKARAKGPIVPAKRRSSAEDDEAAGALGTRISQRRGRGRDGSKGKRDGGRSSGEDSDEEVEQQEARQPQEKDLPYMLSALGEKLPLPSAFKPKTSAPVAASAGATNLGDFEPLPRDVRPSLEDVPFDAMIFLGDLNYRTDLPRLDVELYREKHFPSALEPFPSALPSPPVTNSRGSGRGSDGKQEEEEDKNSGGTLDQLQELLAYDQLERERRLGRAFKGFREGRIRFLPSFKYDKGSARFDSSPKARCPAWTDRVLFAVAGGEGAEAHELKHPSGKPILRLEDYFSVDSRHSDHRPVAAHFSLEL